MSTKKTRVAVAATLLLVAFAGGLYAQDQGADLTVRFDGLVAFTGSDGGYWALLPKADYNNPTTDAYVDAGGLKFPRGVDASDVDHHLPAHFASLVVTQGAVAGFSGRVAIPLVEYGPSSADGQTKVTRFEVVLPSPEAPVASTLEGADLVRFPNLDPTEFGARLADYVTQNRAAFSLDPSLLGAWNDSGSTVRLASRVALPYGAIRLEKATPHGATAPLQYGLQLGDGPCTGSLEMPETAVLSLGSVSSPVRVELRPSDGGPSKYVEVEAVNGRVELSVMNATGGTTFVSEPIEAYEPGHLAVSRWYFNLTRQSSNVPVGGDVSMCIAASSPALGPICPKMFIAE